MTKQADFKNKIRARMEKTGERYAAARHALLRQADASPSALPTVPAYTFRRGYERDHSLLTSALAQAGVTDPASGEAFTETRLFGLSGGIGFMSFLFEYAGHAPMLTFVCRSWSMPGPVITRALTNAGIEHELSETGSAKAARAFLDQALERGAAVHATIDWASLPLAGMSAMWTGGMPRQANFVGRDGDDYVLDVGAPLRLAPAEVARVRGAAKKEKHRAFTFSPGAATEDPVAATRAAVQGTARAMVEAPFRNFASNFGLAALEKQARLCVDAKDKRGWPRVFGSGPLAARALWRTWECVTLELTAPAGSRALYADFLEESARLPGLEELAEAAKLARDSAELFAKLADDIVATTPEVAAAVTISEEIDELQRTNPQSAGQQVKEMRALREEHLQQCALEEEARLEAFARVGAAFAAIHAVETELQKALAGL